MRASCQKLFANFIVPVRNKSLPEGFAHKTSCESFLASLPKYKAGSVEIVVAGEDMVACVAVEEKTESGSSAGVRKGFSNGIRALRRKGASGEVSVLVEEGLEEETAEGVTFGTYQWSLKTRKDDLPIEMTLSPKNLQNEKAWSRGLLQAKTEMQARTLVNLPGNELNPTSFCDRIKEMQVKGLEMRVYDEKELAEMNMHGLKVVGKGSAEPIRMLELKFRGNPSSDKWDVGLVGKGVTFDSGGISIKPSMKMGDMKGDMGGGAAVAMAGIGLAQLAPKVNFICVVPLVENMPSGTATRPGDIYTARNGLTVEVDNTDAEGRLILADALHYVASEFHPEYLIDVATLTGAIVYAIGDQLGGVFATDDAMFSMMNDASNAADQPIWRMPLMPHFAENVKSDVADVCNTGKRGAGACTAAAFLQNFTDKHERWMHMDIAGIMQSPADEGVLTKGMTGAPTRSLMRFVESVAETKS